MSSNLTTLSAAVTRRLGRPTTDALLTAADITAALNDAANQYSVEYPWPWLTTLETIATTNGNDVYAVGSPSTYIETISLWITGSVPLVRMSLAELIRAYPSTASGTPLFFARRGVSSLVVRPIPITTVLPTLQHLYQKAETALAAGGDVLLCPVWYEQAVVELAAAEMLYRAGDKNRGDIARGRYEDLRNRAMEQIRREQAQSDGNDMMPAQPLPPLPGAKTAAA